MCSAGVGARAGDSTVSLAGGRRAAACKAGRRAKKRAAAGRSASLRAPRPQRTRLRLPRLSSAVSQWQGFESPGSPSALAGPPPGPPCGPVAPARLAGACAGPWGVRVSERRAGAPPCCPCVAGGAGVRLHCPMRRCAAALAPAALSSTPAGLRRPPPSPRPPPRPLPALPRASPPRRCRDAAAARGLGVAGAGVVACQAQPAGLVLEIGEDGKLTGCGAAPACTGWHRMPASLHRAAGLAPNASVSGPVAPPTPCRCSGLRAGDCARQAPGVQRAELPQRVPRALLRLRCARPRYGVCRLRLGLSVAAGLLPLQQVAALHRPAPRTPPPAARSWYARRARRPGHLEVLVVRRQAALPPLHLQGAPPGCCMSPTSGCWPARGAPISPTLRPAAGGGGRGRPPDGRLQRRLRGKCCRLSVGAGWPARGHRRSCPPRQGAPRPDPRSLPLACPSPAPPLAPAWRLQVFYVATVQRLSPKEVTFKYEAPWQVQQRRRRRCRCCC